MSATINGLDLREVLGELRDFVRSRVPVCTMSFSAGASFAAAFKKRGSQLSMLKLKVRLPEASAVGFAEVSLNFSPATFRASRPPSVNE